MKKKNILIKIYSILFMIIGKLPKNKRMIIFESYLGKQFSCNPRAIYEYLQQNNSKYSFNMVWSVDKNYEHEFIRQGLNYSNRFTLSWLWKMATAKYWVTNSRLPLWLPKPNKTIYIQTWHGTPLKRLANDMDVVRMPGTTTEKYKKNFSKESSKWDVLISPNKYSTEIFKRAFHFNNTVIETGYPRNDILYKKDIEPYKEKLKKKLGLERKKVILYAPTWRDDNFYSKGNYKFDLKLDLEMIKKDLGNQVVILLRMHYLVNQDFDLEDYKEFIMDVSDYPDIRDLYIISDILVTDYSSVFFDFANLKKPILFYTYDLEYYRDNLRGFYFDIETNAPGKIVDNSDDLIEELKNLLKNPKLHENYARFYNEFCLYEDGKSTKRVVEKIFGKEIGRES
ncbi:CDP-glycerol glycerophosphotransferase family protein [Bacillus inaquosorum]|uniref:CDP-glycerol glycerophosphotransferase family protein n=2 Tax=Bacillus inaquosorum TaxID=483913 RepID=UPI0022822F3D|nr:CDP-glycerol glycerophosphotransferase family protein [Bacillus inaquosorum]MCY7899786.1 CDP-glycerol glycerophosphotransferase family protein [Bacillus inaquosorum]MCY8054951.1 CDP-glycerol glycerophosphotransferase family protein [Bacillus inaquosorum]MCY8263787.1 CDP-glycerol glycerophosphotransferase family protein [Bacillus inaquosorum]MCY8285412.1 CDP-glycerol glycerophosphotransferase family protein [Bacillus inaquosorum]MCY9410089.1 CDP-glycerol glycerophosphotransferase family prot